MTKPILTIVRGLPGSGKSTYARKLAAETGAVLIEPEMLEALINARQFISNGIQFGYIAKPEPGSPEAQTLGVIVDAIKKAEVRECEKS